MDARTRSLRRGPERKHFRDAALLIAAAGLGCLVISAFPPSPGTPVALCVVVGVITLAWAALTFTVAPRMGPRGLELSLLGLTLGGTTITATAATPVGCIGPLLVLVAGIPAMAEILPRGAAWRQALLALGLWVLAMVLPTATMVDWYFVAMAVVIVPLTMHVCVQMVERMNDLALSDALTGTLNRTGLAMQSQMVRSVADRAGLATTVVAIDLDRFKAYNDEHGHPAGDRLLVQLTEAWAGELREADVLARTGGDEFVLVLPGTSPEEAAPLLQRMSERSPAEWTAGVVTWERGVDLETAIEAADDVLYASKRRGPGSAVIPEQAAAVEGAAAPSEPETAGCGARARRRPPRPRGGLRDGWGRPRQGRRGDSVVPGTEVVHGLTSFLSFRSAHRGAVSCRSGVSRGDGPSFSRVPVLRRAIVMRLDVRTSHRLYRQRYATSEQFPNSFRPNGALETRSEQRPG